MTYHILTQEEVKSEKRQKLDACLNLSRARLTQDGRYFSSIFNRLSPNGESNDDTERLMLFILLSCYKNIYEDQIPDLLNYESINSLEKEYKDLLAVEKWDQLFQEKDYKRKIEEESLFLEDILKELQTEFGMYKDVRMSRDQETNPDSSEYDEDYIPIDKQIDQTLSIFGYKLNELPQNVKMIIGFTFLSIIMGIIYFLFYYVKKMKTNHNAKSKKKRN